jgi:tetratricopeptide (TPR) repeat protein
MDIKPKVSAENSPLSPLHEQYFVWMVLLITALTYMATMRFDFVYDDYPQIVFNPFLRAWHFVPQYFVSQVWKHMAPSTPGNYYRPVFLVLMRACYAVFADRPFGWHLVAIGLHLLATWLTYVLVRKMTGQFTTAWLAALIFGVHPIHHEVIAWVSATTESLFAVLFILAFLAYLKSREGSRFYWLSVSCLLYVLSLLSKETAIVLPLLMFAHGWIVYEAPEKEGKPDISSRFRSAVIPAALFVPVALVYLVVRNKILFGLGHSFAHFSFGAWLITLPSILFFYVRNWFVPVGLSESYDLFYQRNLNFAHVLLPALILIALSVAIWMLRDRIGAKPVQLALAWIVIPLLPALDTFVFRPDELVHDRYFYIPSIGAAFLVAMFIERIAKTRLGLFGQPVHVVAAAFALSIVLSFISMKATGFWIDDYHLFTRAHEIAPLNATAMNNLGATMMSRHDMVTAQALFEEGYHRNPEDFRFGFNLGRLYYREGDYKKADFYIEQVIAQNPDLAETYVYLAQIQLKQNQVAEAQKNLRHAVDLNPYSAPFHTSYGVVLALTGDCASANQQFEDALSLNPGDPLTTMQMLHCRMLLSRPAASKPGEL